MLRFKRGLALAAAVALLGMGAGSRLEAALIIDGTDANDHGSVSGGVNHGGWEYMQRALENLGASNAPSVAKVLTVLGTGSGTQARNAISSAFGLSSLVGQGWTIEYATGAAAITTRLNGLGTANSGILYLPTHLLTSGDLTVAEMQAINAGAAQLDAFTLAGGSLFAMGQTGTYGFGWLNTLLPGVTVTDLGGGGISSNITLTPEGAAAFPGLTNADLAGADPWHLYFSGNYGPNLKVLGTAPYNGNPRDVILGADAGSVTRPVPEPASITSLGIAGLVGIGYAWRRRKRSA